MAALLESCESPAALLHSLSRPRFWDETERLPGLFERYRMADDHANAIACFGRLALHGFYNISSSSAYMPAMKSIVSAFQPKAAGTFLHNRMLQMGYQDFSWFFPHRLRAYQCYASVDALKLYNIGGFTCHSHAQPDPNILAAFDRVGIEKIWIHLRNPAECAVSSYHHYLGEGHGSGEIGESRKREALTDGVRQGVGPNTSANDFAVNAITFFITWVASWLRFAQERPERIAFSYYAELDDPQAMISRVFAECNANFCGQVNPFPVSEDRYRATRATDWRSELSTEACRYIEKRVRLELEPFPQFEMLWT